MKTLFLLAVFVPITACEHATQAPRAMAPAGPSLHAITLDTTFHLSADERAAVLPYFDVHALERLLSMMPASQRARTLASFQVARTGEPHRMLVQTGNPKMDAVLEEVWAPFWDGYSDEEMARHPREFPARQLGRLRRAAGGQASRQP
jgi:hypothetical protein